MNFKTKNFSNRFYWSIIYFKRSILKFVKPVIIFLPSLHNAVKMDEIRCFLFETWRALKLFSFYTSPEKFYSHLSCHCCCKSFCSHPNQVFAVCEVRLSGFQSQFYHIVMWIWANYLASQSFIFPICKGEKQNLFWWL